MKTCIKHICLITALFTAVAGTMQADGLRERVYLQTDKQLYLAGELLRMKMYVTDTNGKPLPFSKVGYVELLEGATPQAQVKLEIDNAAGDGWIELPSTLQTGFYRLAAYTRNMKNEGEDVFYYKTIGIINTFRPDPTVQVDTFIRAKDPSTLDNNISVLPGQDSYACRAQGTIEIKGLPADLHSLSISIAGKDLVTPPVESNITGWSKALGQMPRPAYSGQFTPEYEGHIIHGQIRDIQTDEVTAAENVVPILGFVGDQVRVFGAQQKGGGQLEFYTSRIRGMHELATTSFAAGDNTYRINIESPFAQHKDTPPIPFRMNPRWSGPLAAQNLALQVQHAFADGTPARPDTTYAHFRWEPDRYYILDEYTRFTRMDEVVIEFIPSLRFRKFNDKRALSVLDDETATFSIGNSLALLDGIPVTDHELLFRYDPLLVSRIDVYKNKFVFGGQYFSGIIAFTTYKKDYPTLVLDENTQIFDYEGTQTPRPTPQPPASRIPDYRHTLLWDADVKAGGKAEISIPFTTSLLKGDFRVVVEGLAKDGKPVRGTALFSVE